MEMNRLMQQQTAMNNKLQSKGGTGPVVNQPPSSIISPFYRSPEQSPKSLQFDSVFESGNLAIALEVSETEYNLIL